MTHDEPQRTPREIAAGLRDIARHEAANAQQQRTNNRVLWLVVSIGLVVGGVGATISGFAGAALAAGVCGVIGTVAAGAERVFTPDAKRVFHGRQAAAASALADEIDLGLAGGGPSDDQVKDWIERLRVIRSQSTV